MCSSPSAKYAALATAVQFPVEYRKGSTLLIADTFSRAPLPMSSHETVHYLVYRVEFESDHPDLSGFSDVTLQDIRLAAATDREQTELRTLVESGWPTDRASVPESVRPYWDVRSELKSHEGLLYKQDRVVIPTVLRSSILHKLHADHRGLDFTLHHARNTVFWPSTPSG